jgi:hypothetical protein
MAVFKATTYDSLFLWSFFIDPSAFAAAEFTSSSAAGS